MKTQQVVVFDLDDTLYKEVDFLKSAFREIADTIGHPEVYNFMLKCYRDGENVFKTVIERYNLSYTVDQLLEIYRNHKPDITLNTSTVAALNALRDMGVTMGLITDGRSITQRNKIEALGLHRWIDNNNILISEERGFGKPDERCYRHFMDCFPGAAFAYVGDNLNKDFITANRLGWTTICLLNDGQNIFKQDFSISEEYRPEYLINNLVEIKAMLA